MDRGRTSGDVARGRVRLRGAILGLVALLLASGTIVGTATPASAAGVADFGEPFHFLPPLASGGGDASRFDASVLDELVVSICRVTATGCTTVKTLTSQSSLAERLRIGESGGVPSYYLAVWDTTKVKLVPDAFRVSVTLAGLTLGSVQVGPNQYRSFGRTWPIKFLVENHPTIRTRIMRSEGQSASQVANVLRMEFDLDADAVRHYLANDIDPYTDEEIELAIKGVFQDAIVPETTEIADAATRDAMTAYDPTTGTLTFSSATPVLNDLDLGDAFVSEPTAVAPYGLLRVVTSITKPKRGPVVIGTRQAFLNEVITQGTLDAAGALEPDDIDRTEAMAGVRMMTGREAAAMSALDIGDGYSFHETFDITLNGSGAQQGVSGRGTVRVQGSMHFNAGWNVGFGVESCLKPLQFFVCVDRFEAHTGVEFESNIKVTGDFEGHLKRETVLSTKYFKPIVFMIGPIPVVLVPVVKAIAGIDGNAYLDFTFEAQLQASMKIGAKWTDPEDNGNDWENKITPPELSGTGDGDLHATMELYAYAKADAKLLLYGIAGPGFAGRAGVAAKVQFPGNPLWKVFGQAIGEVNFAVDLGGVLKLAEWSHALPSLPFPFAQSENGKPVCGARTEPIPVELGEFVFLGPREDDNSYKGYFVCRDPEGETVDYVATVDGTEIDYIHHKWDVPGTYRVDITASDQSGQSTSFFLTVEVNNQAPVMTVTAPSGSIPATAQFLVAAYASDKEDGGLLPCSSFSWSATGGTATATTDTRSCGAAVVFSQTGQQSVTVQVTDRHGKSSQQVVLVNVTAAPANAAPLIDANSMKVWADQGTPVVCGPGDLDCDTDYRCIGFFCRVPTGSVLFNGAVGSYHPPLTFSLDASDPNGGSVTVTWHCTAGIETFVVTDNGDGTLSCTPWSRSAGIPIKVWAEVSDGTTTVSSEVRSYIMFDRVG